VANGVAAVYVIALSEESFCAAATVKSCDNSAEYSMLTAKRLKNRCDSTR